MYGMAFHGVTFNGVAFTGVRLLAGIDIHTEGLLRKGCFTDVGLTDFGHFCNTDIGLTDTVVFLPKNEGFRRFCCCRRFVVDLS